MVYDFGMQVSRYQNGVGDKKQSKIKKTALNSLKRQVVLIFIFDICGLVHHKFVPTEQTVNKEYYLALLKSKTDRVVEK